MKTNFVYEQVEDILKPKSRENIIKDFENLKENISDILRPKSKEEIQKIIEERTLKLKELYNKFLKDGFEVDLDLKENTLFVTNKRGWSTWFFLNPNGTFQANVMGYKGDISLGNFNDDYKELKSVVNMINKTWMKDADPFGYQW